MMDDEESLKKPIESLTDEEIELLAEKFGVDIRNNPQLKNVLCEFAVTRERIEEIEKIAKRKLENEGKD